MGIGIAIVVASIVGGAFAWGTSRGLAVFAEYALSQVGVEEDDAAVAPVVAVRPEEAWEAAPLDAWVAYYREAEDALPDAVAEAPRVPAGRPAIHGRLASGI